MGAVQPPTIEEQVERGWLVCPVTHAPLILNDTSLETKDRQRRYPLTQGVPLLLADRAEVERYVNESRAMVAEYERRREPSAPGWRDRLEERWNADFRTDASVAAFQSLLADLPPDALCLSVGGGPNRHAPALINVNVGPFPNVDIVGDAH